MDSSFVPILVFALVLLLVQVAMVRLLLRAYRRVKPGEALVIQKTADQVAVSFTGGVVWPTIWTAEVIDVTAKRVEFDLSGADALVCADGRRAELLLHVVMRVSDDVEDVKRVARTVGCERAGSVDGMRELFEARILDAARVAARDRDLAALDADRRGFAGAVRAELGDELGGYVVDDITVRAVSSAEGA